MKFSFSFIIICLASMSTGTEICEIVFCICLDVRVQRVTREATDKA